MAGGSAVSWAIMGFSAVTPFWLPFALKLEREMDLLAETARAAVG
jgi:hypothetical protein